MPVIHKNTNSKIVSQVFFGGGLNRQEIREKMWPGKFRAFIFFAHASILLAIWGKWWIWIYSRINKLLVSYFSEKEEVAKCSGIWGPSLVDLYTCSSTTDGQWYWWNQWNCHPSVHQIDDRFVGPVLCDNCFQLRVLLWTLWRGPIYELQSSELHMSGHFNLHS